MGLQKAHIFAEDHKQQGRRTRRQDLALSRVVDHGFSADGAAGGSVQNPSPVRVAHLFLRVLNRWNSTAVAGWSAQESPASTGAERDECHSARETFQTLSSANSTPVATASGRNSPKRGPLLLARCTATLTFPWQPSTHRFLAPHAGGNICGRQLCRSQRALH